MRPGSALGTSRTAEPVKAPSQAGADLLPLGSGARPKRSAARARALVASVSRSRAGAVVTSESTSRRATAATSSIDLLNISSLALDG